jgi:protein DGCR14
MASSQSQALAKRSSDTALMPPPPAPKRQKRPAKVLDEDVYSDALSHIIARDFFPGLLETEAQKEYLEALDSDNKDWIREAGRKLTQVMTPVPDGQRRSGRGTSFTPRRSTALGDTPRSYVGETPRRTPVNDDFAPEVSTPEVDINLSLGAFQAKYTSEDNESFNDLLDKQNQKRAAKYTFFHNGNKIPSARQIAYRERQQKLLGDSDSSSSALVRTSGSSRAVITTNAAGEERSSVVPNRPSADLDARPASVESFPNRQGPRNHFMFGPDSVEDRLITRAQISEEASNAPPKQVKYAATRFPAALEPENIIPASPSMSAIDAAIAGRPMPTESESGYGGAETPRVNGYAFVDAEPTPSELGIPVSDEEADAAEREAANKLLPRVDDSPNPFSIASRSKREDLHLKLVEKADSGRRTGGRMEQLRNLGITPGRTPTPKFASASRKGTAMTPAAQSLANRIGTPHRKGGIFDSGRQEKAGWTPTPKVKRPS